MNFLCVCGMCSCVCGYMCVCVHVGVQVASSVACHISFWSKIFHWAWSSPTQLDWLASELQESPCLCLSSTGITGVHHDLCHFYPGARQRHSGPHVYVVSTLVPSHLRNPPPFEKKIKVSKQSYSFHCRFFIHFHHYALIIVELTFPDWIILSPLLNISWS